MGDHNNDDDEVFLETISFYKVLCDHNNDDDEVFLENKGLISPPKTPPRTSNNNI